LLARNFFGTHFRLATDAEQRYLVVMDSLGDPPYGSSDIVRAYGAKDQRGVSIHRDALIQKGITWAPRRGRLDFTVPLFAEYLRENHPLVGHQRVGLLPPSAQRHANATDKGVLRARG